MTSIVVVKEAVLLSAFVPGGDENIESLTHGRCYFPKRPVGDEIRRGKR